MRNLTNGFGAGSTELFVFRVISDLITPQYVLITLKSSFFMNIGETKMTGTAGQKRLPHNFFAYHPIPLPPLAEQRRIVARVDELMAICDTLEAQLQARAHMQARVVQAALARVQADPSPASIATLLDPKIGTSPADLRQMILTLAVQGKLVPQDPHDEPAEVLLEKILTEYQILVQSGKIKNKQNAEIFTTSQYPNNWVVTTLSAVCTSITDGDHLPPPKTNFGIPFLVIGNVRWGTIDFRECRYVSNEYYESLDSTRKPKLGDILYTLVGSFGIPVLVNTNEKFCVQPHIGIIRPSVYMHTQFLSYLLASNMFYVQAEAIATGIAQKTVPILGLRKIPIPLPPLAEQRRIVARVDELMALVDRLEAQQAQASALGAQVLDALVGGG